MPSAKKPPSDPAQAARSVLDQITGEKPPLTPEKNAAAVELGRRGGEARKAALSPEERSRIAREAAQTRWQAARTAGRFKDGLCVVCGHAEMTHGVEDPTYCGGPGCKGPCVDRRPQNA